MIVLAVVLAVVLAAAAVPAEVVGGVLAVGVVFNNLGDFLFIHKYHINTINIIAIKAMI